MFVVFINIMISLRKVAGAFLRSNVQAVSYGLSNGNWKGRDEAAEKVFMTELESSCWLMQGTPLRNS